MSKTVITQDARHYREDQKFLAKKQKRTIMIAYALMALVCGIVYYVAYMAVHV